MHEENQVGKLMDDNIINILSYNLTKSKEIT